MKNDLSIIYNGKVLEVRASLDQLKELEFNTEKMENAIKKIEERVEKEVADNYSAFDDVASKPFLHDSLATTYKKAIEKLDRIKNIIDGEYNEYLKINAKYKSLSQMLENVSEENIESLSQKGRELLNDIRNSSIVDYKMEQNLVENIYAILYKIIKFEIIYKGKSSISNYAKTDETDSTYFAKLVKDNITELDEDSKTQITKLIVNLSIDGLTNDDYLDDNLLNTIIVSEDDELAELINKNFLEKLEDYEELNRKYEIAVRRNQNLSEKANELKVEKKHKGRSKLRKRIFIDINAVVVAMGILASGYVLKDMTKTNEYKTTTTTYNSVTDELKEKETFEEESEYSLEITEYSPWIEPGYFRDGYSREVYKYDLSDLEKSFPNLEDYLTEELKTDISSTNETQTKEEKPKDLGYKENKYIIKEIKQDKTVYNTVISPVAWALTTSATAILIILLDRLVAFKLLSKKKYSELKEAYKESKRKLTQNNIELLEVKEELSNLVLQIVNSREQAMKTYEDLPEPVKEMPKIKQKIRELEDKTNS